MYVKVKLFPAVYFHSVCQKHQCKVEVGVDESKPFQKDCVIGGVVMALKCQEGGTPEVADCTDSWILDVSAMQSDIVITA